MTKNQFMDDLQTIYDELQMRQAKLNDYYKLVNSPHPEAESVINQFLEELEIRPTSDNIMASLIRIIGLREDSLEQVLQKLDFTEDEIIDKKEDAYRFVSRFYLDRHSSLIAWIEDNNLLTPFYRTLIYGVNSVGQAMSGWQSVWTARIIHGVNRDLYKLFNGDEEKIYQKLERDRLYDLDDTGAVGDRCYSILHKDKDGKYHIVSYAEAFKKEVAQVVLALDALVNGLQEEVDEVFFQRNVWIEYISAIKQALEHTNPNELIREWANVDRAWMKITTPLQIGHPLEYYEDHYRKAVALEWDLRIINPNLQKSSNTRENIKQFALELGDRLGGKAPAILENNIKQVNRTQLYIGQPVLFYGAEFNGLFSAQVVPNDEQVSTELGKKIFAYADFVMASKKSKPIMRLNVEIMGEDFVNKQRKLIETEPLLWHKIYDISTIGHEFGHILWITKDTELKMNRTGQFKNIEEFKATAGGLMAFFHDEDEELKKYLVDDLVSRAVGLMAWQSVGEVLPYYCEGLIHLDILFKSGIITFSEQIRIDYSRYDIMKALYQEAYKDLASQYIRKIDAGSYLYRYVSKDKNIYLPKDSLVKEFVEFYYHRYKEIGQESCTKLT